MPGPGSFDFEKSTSTEYVIKSPQVPRPPVYRQQAVNELIDRPAMPPSFLETLPDRNAKGVRIARRWIIAGAITLLLLFTAVIILATLLVFAKKAAKPLSSDPSPIRDAPTITQITTQSTTYTATQTNWNASTQLTTITAWSTTSVSDSSSTSSSSSMVTKTVSVTTTINPTYDVTTSTVDKTVSIAHTTKTTTLDASTNSDTETSIITSTETDKNPLVYKPTYKPTVAITLSSTSDTSETSGSSTATINYPNPTALASPLSDLATAASSEPTSAPSESTSAPTPDCNTEPLVLANNFCVMVNSCNATSADVKDNDCKNMCHPGLGLQLCSLDKSDHPKEYACCNKCGCRGSGGPALVRTMFVVPS